MVYFLTELGLMNFATVMYCPSVIAASAVYAARCTINKVPVWTETLKMHTDFSEPQLIFFWLVVSGSLRLDLWAELFKVESEAAARHLGCSARPVHVSNNDPLPPEEDGFFFSFVLKNKNCKMLLGIFSSNNHGRKGEREKRR
ncbi:Cyclin N-terminal domain-containing protein [Forsythia ovata]|uniref:Cyclin N-terminal domain-containing protein n=1 Tax=Forsythia ovata TaxID=205694 RepID=A0ABD1X1U3_9LAMI